MSASESERMTDEELLALLGHQSDMFSDASLADAGVAGAFDPAAYSEFLTSFPASASASGSGYGSNDNDNSYGSSSYGSGNKSGSGSYGDDDNSSGRKGDSFAGKVLESESYHYYLP